MWKLLQGLIWPAVAGNVVWAFFTVAIGKWNKLANCDSLVIAQLVALVSLGVYLAADWWYTNDMKEKNEKNKDIMKRCCWPFDAFLAIAIAVSAIALSQDVVAIQLAKCTVGLAFITTAIGHCCGAWEVKETIEDENCKHNRRWLAGINFSGFLILLILSLIFQKTILWPLSIAILVVVAGYLIFAECKMKTMTN